MEAFDKFINNVITPSSVPAGVSAVFLTFFTSKLGPKLPDKFYKLLDNPLIKIAAVAFLINQQIHKPSLAVIISIAIVVGLEFLINMVAPETPKLSELVKPTAEDEKKSGSNGSNGCNCYCGTIYTDKPPQGSKVQEMPHSQMVKPAGW